MQQDLFERRNFGTNVGTFKEVALDNIVRLFANDALVTGEDIRVKLENAGIVPRHYNEWGPVIDAALDRGILRLSGNRKHMRTKKSHGRSTDIYRVRHPF